MVMNEAFILSVTYQGNEYEYKARSERWGYTHRIAVLIDETTYTFEPDEEGGYRVMATESTSKGNPVSLSLLGLIAEKLKTLSE
jgi:hypothetical protein